MILYSDSDRYGKGHPWWSLKINNKCLIRYQCHKTIDFIKSCKEQMLSDFEIPELDVPHIVSL